MLDEKKLNELFYDAFGRMMNDVDSAERKARAAEAEARKLRERVDALEAMLAYFQAPRSANRLF